MAKVRIVVSFSGGKDSQATLIWAVNKYGKDRVEAVFCDTGWEHPVTYEHLHKVVEQLGVKLTILKSKRFKNFQDMCISVKIFPSAHWRFCTAHLKVIPMIDWVLGQDDNLIIMQGIRAKESKSRANMEAECMYFKEYYETPKEGEKKRSLYKAKAVREWCKTHDASLIRPIFDWTAQQVIDYILANRQRPNPLYEKGSSRVGCFPCIMARKHEIKIVAQDKEMSERLITLERDVNEKNNITEMGFFSKGAIPERFCRTWGKGCPTAQEVFDYVTRDDLEGDLFADTEENYSCMSLYHGLCE